MFKHLTFEIGVTAGFRAVNNRNNSVQFRELDPLLNIFSFVTEVNVK